MTTSATTADARPTPTARTRVDHVPADGLLHPLILAGITLLVVNDHLLKAAFPGLVTGKLSDVAGLLFFPALLVAAAEVLAATSGRDWRHGPLTVGLACGATVAGFAAVKLTAFGALAFGTLLGWAQSVAGSVVAGLVGGQAQPAALALVARDPWDLVALPAVLLAAWIGLARSAALRPEIAR